MSIKNFQNVSFFVIYQQKKSTTGTLFKHYANSSDLGFKGSTIAFTQMGEQDHFAQSVLTG